MSSTSDSPVEETPLPPEKAPNPAPATPTIIVQSTGTGCLQRFMMFAGWSGFILCAFSLMSYFGSEADYFDTSDGVKEQFHSRSQVTKDKIAIIDVSGVILSS